VICATCGTENAPGAKFCMECAARLVLLCPNCGTANAPVAKFCSECATALAAGTTPAPPSIAPAPPVGSGGQAQVAERRLVSVLFADLVGFTTLAEGRDAEETRELLSGYFVLARDVIGRYGGTVEKFIGDAVMAVWGAPVAHEDDAERAVRAALELVDAVRSLGPTVQARAGVLTGEAAVTLGATGEGMVAGDLVNTASRIQSVAAPGTVLVGEATHRAASRAIEFEPAGEQTLKGKTSPVPAWRARRIVAEVGGRGRSEALEAPFVGRDDELRLLRELFHASRRDDRARLVSVIGPGGIGKTRLAREFLRYIDGLVDTVWWHDGRSPAYGDGISFWALGEMVRARCGLLETDDAATTRAKVAETLAAHVPDPDERRWIEPALLTLLGVETGTGSEQLFGAWRTFFERLADTAPVVMVFEDFHFADSGLLAFVDHLMEWSRNVSITVITLARPELLDKRPDWGAGKRNFTSIYLEPLPEAAMRELLAGLVPGLPESAVRSIVARADGVPLYAVETVRMLIADGRLRLEGGVYHPAGDLTDLAVPETLTALIASRLDTLAPDDRALISDAAVLGQSFTPAGLSAVSGMDEAELEPRLRTLVRRELLALEVDPRSPERGQYAFVQALIREVAYNTLARRDRKVRHLAAARFFESLGTDELAGALAGHYLAAHANASADDEAEALAAQARITLRAAADRAISLGSLAQAVTFLDQAREVTSEPAEVAELLERAGWAAAMAGLTQLAEDRLRAAIDRRRELGDADELAGAIAKLGSFLTSTFRVDAGLAVLAPAVDETIGPETTPRGPGGVDLLAQLARAYFFEEDQRRAVEVAEQALEAGERLDLAAVVSDVLITKGSALCHLGRSYEGLGTIRAGVALADELGLISTGLRGRINLGVLAGDPRTSYEAADAGLAIARRHGLQAYMRTLSVNLASAAIDVGEWDRAARELTAARDESVDELGANHAAWALLQLEACRGDDVRAEGVRLTAWAEGLNDQGARDAVHDLRAYLALATSDLREACDEWFMYAPTDTLNAPATYLLAGMVALMSRDVGRARQAVTGLDAVPGHARLRTLDARLLRAGIAALEEEDPGSVRDMLGVIAEYDRWGLAWRAALAGAVLARTAGGQGPEVERAVAAARETLARLGARPFLEVLDEVTEEVAPGGTIERQGQAEALGAPDGMSRGA
jgi:class 3 adenylate cyclase/tetratricopeptide (TPR) repeat protein